MAIPRLWVTRIAAVICRAISLPYSTPSSRVSPMVIWTAVSSCWAGAAPAGRFKPDTQSVTAFCAEDTRLESTASPCSTAAPGLELADCGIAAACAVAVMSAEGDHRFPGQALALQEGQNRCGRVRGPDGIADEDHIIIRQDHASYSTPSIRVFPTVIRITAAMSDRIVSLVVPPPCCRLSPFRMRSF